MNQERHCCSALAAAAATGRFAEKAAKVRNRASRGAERACQRGSHFEIRLFLESIVPAPTRFPTVGTTARKFSAWRPLGAMRRLVVSFSISRSLPLLIPASEAIELILEPRSKPASFPLKRPTFPVVISLFKGPARFRSALSEPV